MRIDSSGNMGIGTSSPAFRLQVETPTATGNTVGYFRQGSGAVALINSATDLVGFGNGATAGETRIFADGASGFVTLRTNSSECMRITSAGNVGIGTSSPASLLNLQSSTANPAIRITDASGAGTRGGNISGSWGGNGLYLDSLGASGWVYIGLSPGGGQATTLRFDTANTERMRIDSSGRLLVGTTAVTTSSSQSGEIYSIGATGFMMTNSTATNYALAVKNEGTSGTRNLINFYEGSAGGTARTNMSFDGSANFFVKTGGATDLLFGTNNTERMRITSGGDMLIGTSSAPGTGQLQVVRNANDGLTRFLVCNSNAGSSTTSYMLFGNDAYSGGFAGIRATSSTNTTAEFGGAGNGLNIFNNVSTLTLGTGGVTRMTITQAGVTGIQFAPTQVSSADANTLDDYEEGSWTPDLRFGGSTTGITYAAGGQVGRYTKIGNMVYAGFYIELTSKGSASGQARLYGMPFASVNSEAGRMGTAAGYYANFNSAVTTILLMMEANQTNATLRYSGAGGATDLTATLFNNNIGLYGVFIYQTPT